MRPRPRRVPALLLAAAVVLATTAPRIARAEGATGIPPSPVLFLATPIGVAAITVVGTGLVADGYVASGLLTRGFAPRGLSIAGTVAWSLVTLACFGASVLTGQGPYPDPLLLVGTGLSASLLALSIDGLRHGPPKGPPKVAVAPAVFATGHHRLAPGLALRLRW